MQKKYSNFPPRCHCAGNIGLKKGRKKVPLFFCCPLVYVAQGVGALRWGRSGKLHKGDRGMEKKAILTYLALRRGNLARRASGFCEGVRTQRDNLLMDNLFMALSAFTCLLWTSNPVAFLNGGRGGG